MVIILAFLLTACGGNATPDPSTIAAAVQATLAALPQPSPQVVELTRVVEVEVTREIEVLVEVTTEKIVTPTPTNTPRPTPTPTPRVITDIPPRQPYLHSYEITEEYDRFDQKTLVSLKPSFTETEELPHGSLAVSYSYDGTEPTPPLLVGFALMSINDTWEFMKCHDLTLIVNENAPRSLETLHNGTVGRGYVIEQVVTLMALNEFLALANADTVEGKLCRTVFELTPSQIAALRDLASRMQP